MVVDFCAGFLRNFHFGKTFATQVWHTAYYLGLSTVQQALISFCQRNHSWEVLSRFHVCDIPANCFPLYTSATRLDYYSSLKYNMDILRGEQWAYESADSILRVCILAKRNSSKEKSSNEVSSVLRRVLALSELTYVSCCTSRALGCPFSCVACYRPREDID